MYLIALLANKDTSRNSPQTSAKRYHIIHPRRNPLADILLLIPGEEGPEGLLIYLGLPGNKCFKSG
jgi:hypothetical protein